MIILDITRLIVLLIFLSEEQVGIYTYTTLCSFLYGWAEFKRRK